MKLYLHYKNRNWVVDVPIKFGPILEIGALHENAIVTKIDYGKRIYELDKCRILKFPPIYSKLNFNIQGPVLNIFNNGVVSVFPFVVRLGKEKV